MSPISTAVPRFAHPSRTSTALLLAATTLQLPMSPSHAQALPDAQLPTVTVTGEAQRPAAKTRLSSTAEGLPAGTTVVEADEIGTINVGKDISNIFRRVPGVVANNLDQGDTGNGFRMRGFATQGTHGADTAVHVDGVPQNMPSSEAGAGHGPAFLEWLTPDMIQRVEVIKGPVSARHGDQNRSGAVNIFTQSGNLPSSIGVTIESYGGRRASISHSGKIGSTDSVLVADVYRTDGYRKGAWLDRDNLFWKLSTQDRDARYSLRVNHYRSSFEAAGYLDYQRLAAGNLERSAAEPNALPAFGSGKRSSLVVNRTPLADAGLFATVYVEAFERVRGAAAGSLLHNVGADDRSIYGGSVSYRAVPLATTSVHIGTDFRRDQGDGTRRRYQNRVPTPTYLTNLDLDLVTYGLFAELQHKPADTLKVTAGLRSDWFDYAIGNRKLPQASTDYKDAVLTPKLGLAWNPARQVGLFANVAEGFRSVAAQQISPAGAAGPLGAAGGRTNVDVSPSKVRSFDIGFTADPLRNWSLYGAFFHTLNEDEIVQTAPNVFASVGDTTRRGVELESRWRTAHGLALYASYTRLLQAEINNPPPNSPRLVSVARHQLKAGLDYMHAMQHGTLRYNLDAYLTSGIPYFSGTPLVQRTVPTYTRYDARVAWEYRKIQLSAFAVLQPQAISESFFATAAGISVSPQARRHVGVSLRYFY